MYYEFLNFFFFLRGRKLHVKYILNNVKNKEVISNQIMAPCPPMGCT